MSSSFRSAFTVVEFLVVMAVVAVLVVLLLPKYNEYAENQRRITCANHLRQIGIALRVYASDHGGYLPTLENNRQNRTWDGALLAGGYMQLSVLRCPSDRFLRPKGVLPRSYAISCGEKWSGPNRYWIHGANLNCPFLTNAAEIAVVTERIWGNAWSPGDQEHGNWCDRTWICSMHFRDVNPWQSSLFIRETNYLFLDGHVAWCKEPSDRMFPPAPGGSKPCP